MKKNLIIAAAALVAMCACTKNEVTSLPDQEINFQVASYVNQTKADPVQYEKFSTSLQFGTYAWQTGNAETTYFMNNQEIKNDGGAWKANGKVYYWPKTGTVDFISYAPYASSPWLTVKQNTLEASVTSLGTSADYLYADKAVGYSANGDGSAINDGASGSDSGFSGVPTLFRHALAQVSAKVYAAQLYDGATLAESDVRWTINVDAASLNNVADGGTLSMPLASSSATGMVGWTLPTGSVWTTTTYNKSYTFNSTPVTATSASSAHELLGYTSVIPQKFVAEDVNTTKYPDGQYISITVTVNSYNKKDSSDSDITNLYSSETFTNDIPLTEMVGANVSWMMNYRYLYTICIDPSSRTLVSFDPAVTAWANDSGSATWTL